MTKMKETLKRIADLLPEERVEFFRPRKESEKKWSDRFQLWKTFYFPERHFFKPHIYQRKQNMFKQRLMDRTIKSYAEIGFAECGKTSDFRYFVIYSIIYGIDKYVIYQSSVQANSDNFIQSIISLITTKQFKLDYGEVINENKAGLNIKEKKRKLNKKYLDFKNGATIESKPFGSSIRGATDIETGRKPTMYISDDIVTSKIAISEVQKEGIKMMRDEALRSTDSSFGINIFLGNVVPGGGISNEIIEKRQMPFMVIPITNKVYYITWGGSSIEYIERPEEEYTNWWGKWKLTNSHIRRENEKRPKHKWYSSVEEKKLLLPQFESEYECVLTSAKDRYFYGYKEQSTSTPLKTLMVNEIKLFIYKEKEEERVSNDPYNRVRLRYIVGIDPSTGEGGDHTSLVVYDKVNGEVVAYAQENRATQKEWLPVISHINSLYEIGQRRPKFVIERNGVGVGLIELIRNSSMSIDLYREKQKDKVGGKVSHKYGFTTTETSKNKILSKLHSDINNIKLNDENIIRQVETMTFKDLKSQTRTSGLDHNFDAVMALAMAFEGKEESSALAMLL